MFYFLLREFLDEKKVILLAILFFSAFTLQKDESVLSLYKLGNNPSSLIKLPKLLREISGVAISDNNRIFAHEDEKGIIYQIDLQSGNIVKSFSLGKNIINDDFEDIAIAKKKFYLLTSTGCIYEFLEGNDKEKVEYKKYYSGLTEENNVEGMCYDPEAKSLLLACKDFPGIGFDNYRTVYSFSLSTYKLEKNPRFVLPIDYITQKLSIKNFRPSGIARHPNTGTFFIISANGKAIIEVSQEGKIIHLKKLLKQKHNQPEGIAFTSDYDLLISDEGKEYGQITIYSAKK